jgi:hypothetical protein
VEQFSASSRGEGLEALTDDVFHFLEGHGRTVVRQTESTLGALVSKAGASSLAA